MKTKTCPICQGEDLFLCKAEPTGGIRFGFFKFVPVYASVCLTCGFVEPTLDSVGLSAIREKARMEQFQIHEEAGKQEVREL